ncbi:hypothetical protein CTA2_10472 [Colletotrichum tanaceti]|uniref:Uncharacterized protein n=1 Tax=Colletotrichum tanaceti TaxID=1306861 RepID=A0A4U6XTZ4_9PEZI|nr:hypothetical protein CTA2_10472 [Colletotrichum tanaceti]TKW59392.1 hypothetical protein CTA1_10212 [Colletotrichum tanaceti]
MAAMASSSRYIAGLAVLSSLANAKVYKMPEATTSFDFPLDQFSPQPTKAPAYADLRRRQTSTITTVLVAPDNTCGFISGRAGAAYTCGSTASCLFFTAVDSTPGRVACCGSQECGARRTCYDSRQVSSSSLCDGGCLVDRFTLKCTNTARPYCNTISFSESIFDYWCNTAEISTPQAAVTTYEGQSARAWSPLALTDDPTSTSPGRTSINSVTTTVEPGPVTSTSAPDPDNDEKPVPIGAIVGGVVGGVAVIALVGLGIWFLLRKKKQNPQGQQQQQQQQQQPPMNQQRMSYAPGPGPHGSPPQNAAITHSQSFYDPKFGGQGGYPQSFGGTPPPPQQGGYQQPYYGGNMAVPDRADTTSPGAVSQMTQNRLSMQPQSQPQPVSPSGTPGGFQQYGQPQQPLQPQQPPPATIHEAPTNGDGHRGHMHELA